MRAYVIRNIRDDSITILWAEHIGECHLALSALGDDYKLDRIGLVQKQFTTSK